MLAGSAALWCGCGGAHGAPEELNMPNGGLRAVSLNLAMESDARTVLHDITRVPAVRSADVLFFQEAVHSSAAKEGVPGEVARAMGMHVAFSPEAPGVYNRGLAILSRYPIRDVRILKLRVYNLRFHNRARLALAATVDAPSGRVRCWNVHLDTRINAEDRVAQISPVVDEAARLPGPKIIGGDFNTNYIYWAWNVVPLPGLGRQGEAVREYMNSRGFRAPLQDGLTTFPRTGMHLDWIYEQGLRTKRAAVAEMPFSDHRALVVQFEPVSPLPRESRVESQ